MTWGTPSLSQVMLTPRSGDSTELAAPSTATVEDGKSCSISPSFMCGASLTNFSNGAASAVNDAGA